MRAVFVVALAGCDGVLGLTNVENPPPHVACTAAPVPFMCADFDDANMGAYAEGVLLPFPLLEPGIVAVVEPPAASSPNALWVDTTMAPSKEYTLSYLGAVNVTKVNAGVDIYIDAYDERNTTEIVEIGIETASDRCHVQLQLDHQQISVRNKVNGGTGPETAVFGEIPSGWQHYTLDLDIANRTAAAGVGASQVTIDLGCMFPAGGHGYGAIGVFYINNGGPRLAFDNLLVTTE